MDSPVRVLIVDDHAVVRTGIRLLEGKLPDAGTNEVAIHEMFMKGNGWKLGHQFGMDISDDDWMPGRFVVVGILLFLYAMRLILRGDLAGAARAIGTRSAEEEVEDEIRDLKGRQAGEAS